MGVLLWILSVVHCGWLALSYRPSNPCYVLVLLPLFTMAVTCSHWEWEGPGGHALQERGRQRVHRHPFIRRFQHAGIKPARLRLFLNAGSFVYCLIMPPHVFCFSPLFFASLPGSLGGIPMHSSLFEGWLLLALPVCTFFCPVTSSSLPVGLWGLLSGFVLVPQERSV